MCSAPVHFDILVAEGFVLTELAGVVDVLRVANRISKRASFSWTFRSAQGGPVASSAAATIQTEPFSSRPRCDYAFVLGNTYPDNPALSLGATISGYNARQARVVLLSEAASRYIADRGNDLGGHTTHWENRAVLLEKMELADTNAALMADTGGIITCAGMGATVDMTLSLASQHVSSAIMMTVADILLHERIRHPNTLQPYAGRAAASTGDRDIDTCIGLMQQNIEFPISISEIAAQANLSKRSIERRFHAVLRTTPNGYYRELRLAQANNLLLNTQMSINEIGLACGFPSGFSVIYKAAFGMTPVAARRKGRAR